MRYFLFLGVILFICSCKPDAVELSSNPYDSLVTGKKVYYLDSVTESDFISAKYVFPLANDTVSIDTTRIKESLEGIKIFLQNNDSVVLKNDTSDGENYVTYHYKKTLSEINFVHIQGTYYEWTSDFLINLKDGRKTRMWEYPIFSPNRKLFICYSSDLESGEMVNGIQLFSLKDGMIQNVFEKELIDWAPNEIKWSSDSTLLIRRERYDENHNSVMDYVRMKIKE